MPKSKRKNRSKSKSGYIGVKKNTRGNKFEARIKIEGKCKSLSYYNTAKQAAKAYDKEAIKLRRPFSKLNYPKKAPVGYTPLQQPLQSRNTVGYRGVYKTASLKYQVSIFCIHLHTKQPKKQPLPGIVLFSNLTDPLLY